MILGIVIATDTKCDTIITLMKKKIKGFFQKIYLIRRLFFGEIYNVLHDLNVDKCRNDVCYVI